jgi:AcrR family transcriptional regulator
MHLIKKVFALCPKGKTALMNEARNDNSRSERRHNTILQTAIDLVDELGFRAVSIELIAAKAGVAKTTIYRRWSNKAAVVMDGFMLRFGSPTQFPKAKTVTDSIRRQMRTMARAFRSRDGALIKALLAEAQFDAELATAFYERWTLPRRKMALAVFQKAISQGELRSDIDLETTIDLLYAPMYYRLQMGTGSLSDAYIDQVFNHVMEGLLQRKGPAQKDGRQ